MHVYDYCQLLFVFYLWIYTIWKRNNTTTRLYYFAIIYPQCNLVYIFDKYIFQVVVLILECGFSLNNTFLCIFSFLINLTIICKVRIRFRAINPFIVLPPSSSLAVSEHHVLRYQVRGFNILSNVCINVFCFHMNIETICIRVTQFSVLFILQFYVIISILIHWYFPDVLNRQV